MKPNLLVIDNEESLRFSFHGFLKNDGHDVATAESRLQTPSSVDAIEFDPTSGTWKGRTTLHNDWSVSFRQENDSRNERS